MAISHPPDAAAVSRRVHRGRQNLARAGHLSISRVWPVFRATLEPYSLASVPIITPMAALLVRSFSAIVQLGDKHEVEDVRRETIDEDREPRHEAREQLRTILRKPLAKG
jgi:hypothetical protein